MEEDPMKITGAAAHKLTKAVAEAILSIKGALIFGGYVRDSILHDAHAKAFYENECVQNIPTMHETTTKYADTAHFLPQYPERTLVPTDIDCFMRSSDLALLMEALASRDLLVVSNTEYPLSKYQDDSTESSQDEDPDHRLYLQKLRVGVKVSPIMASVLSTQECKAVKRMRVNVDVVHAMIADKMEPPFGKIDYECNALILCGGESQHIRGSFSLFYKWESPLERHHKLSQIIQDIQDKRAVAFEKSPMHRTYKMMRKGWHLVADGFQLIPATKLERDDVCLLCLAKFTGKHTHALKRTCCAAKYHPKCFAALVSNNNENFAWECPMCRNEIREYEVQNRQIELW